jgi:hypothetical protein
MFTSHSSTEKVTLAQLLGLPFITRSTQIDIYRGGQKTTQTFEESVPVNRDFGGALINTPIASEVLPRVHSTTQVPPADRMNTATIQPFQIPVHFKREAAGTSGEE